MAARARFRTLSQAFAARGALVSAVRAVGRARIAVACGVQTTAVAQWTFVPARHVAAVAAVSGVPAVRLRPDLPAPVERAARDGLAHPSWIEARAAMAAHHAAADRFARGGF